MNNLIDKLKKFVDGKKPTDIIPTTLREVREIYRPREQYPKTFKLIYHIFNSIYNRIPNFKVKSVLIDKMEYAFRIGTGMASYNTLPLTWLQDSIIKFKNFLMKDRGHITTLVCWKYKEEFSTSIMMKVVDTMSKKYKGVENWKDDFQLKKAVDILHKVKAYLVASEKRQLSLKKLKKNCVVSIQEICDNVTEFDNNLYDTPIAIEVRKESVWAHSSEILGINNLSNKWLDFQKAFLDWTRAVMQKQGSDDFFRSVLQIDTLRETIDELLGWNIDSGFPLLSTALKSYKKKVAQYSEILPLRLLGIRRKYKVFNDRSDSYYCTKEPLLLSQLESISEEITELDIAEDELKLANTIILNSKWNDYVIKQKELFKNHKGGSTDTKNLEDAKIEREDYGLACIDTVMELCSKVPGMDKRNPEEMVNNVVEHFVDALNGRLEEVCENETLFSKKKHMQNRFKHIIMPAYTKVLEEFSSDEGLNKEKLFRSTLRPVREMLNGQTSFYITTVADEHTTSLKIIQIDFDKSRKESGLDLGKKNHSMGYTSTNVFAQIWKENRAHGGDYDIDTLEYWKAKAKANLERVREEKNKKQLFDDGQYMVLADAEKLYNQLHPKDKK